MTTSTPISDPTNPTSPASHSSSSECTSDEDRYDDSSSESGSDENSDDCQALPARQRGRSAASRESKHPSELP